MVNRASKKDLEQIMPIVSDIIKEMHSVENYQWDNDYPTEEIFAKDIENNDLYVYKDKSGKVLGFVCIDSHQPNEYSSPEWQHEGDVLVIHRMAVDTNSRGLGIGKALMKHAEELAKTREVNIIRSDTYSTNQTMNYVFKKLGYEFTGEIFFLDRTKEFYCYEKWV